MTPATLACGVAECGRGPHYASLLCCDSCEMPAKDMLHNVSQVALSGKQSWNQLVHVITVERL